MVVRRYLRFLLLKLVSPNFPVVEPMPARQGEAKRDDSAWTMMAEFSRCDLKDRMSGGVKHDAGSARKNECVHMGATAGDTT
jgi:hypothetical protein